MIGLIRLILLLMFTSLLIWGALSFLSVATIGAITVGFWNIFMILGVGYLVLRIISLAIFK